MSSSTKREVRREEYSTNVIRTLQPSRPLSPYSQKSDFDNNLDNILDDLQHSISRPGSSLGQPMTNYSSHRDVQYIQPANATTVLRERSLSPNSTSNRVYKTTKYEYSTSAGGSGQNSYTDRGNINEINKLDTLLNDLENERTATLERSKRSTSNNIGIDSGLIEPGTKVIKTTTTYTSKNPVSRELVFDSPDRVVRHQSPPYDTRSVETTSRRNVTYTDDGLYGKPRQTISPTPPPASGATQYHVTETRTRTLSPTPVNTGNVEKYVTETRTVNNEVVPIPKSTNYNELVQVENSSGPEILRELHLSNDIMPRPKTKVTTTIRTYTYEIPDDENSALLRPDRDPPKNNAVFYKTERNEKNVNYYPNETSPLTIQEVQTTPPPSHTTTVYKYSTNTTNTSHQSPPQISSVPAIGPPSGTNYPPNSSYPSTGTYPPAGYPPTNQTVIYKTETTTNKYGSPQPSNNYPDAGYPPPVVTSTPAGNIPPGGITIYPPSTNQTTIYKTETTTNKQYRSPTPSNNYPDTFVGYPPNQSHPPPHNHHPHHPNEPSVVVYKQTTTTTRGGGPQPPQQREPGPHPFPVDGPIITEVDGSPPKRVEDLMATFGDTSEIHYTNKRVQIAEKPLTPTTHNLSSTTTKVYSSDTTDDDKDKNKSVVPSRNVAGPPVYYPPNHELFTSKESSQAAAGYRAQGGWAREKGAYKYEAESRSKTTTKSGAAVVPLCCPLCCAMPCTIM